MGRHFQIELDRLRKSILTLSSLVESSLEEAILAIKNRDVELAQKIIDGDNEVDRMEVEVEEECLKILALHQPVASDLRYVIAILKINNDLERIGDIVTKIARNAISLTKRKEIVMPFDFDEMAKLTRSMLHRSLDSLVDEDSELAQQVCIDDDEIDKINRQVYKRVYAELQKKPELAKPLMNCLSVSRNLERISDYATNIAEDTIYMIEGRIIRHHTNSSDFDL